jgi:putative membrane protein
MMFLSENVKSARGSTCLRHDTAALAELGFYVSLAVVGGLLWWASRYRASLLPAIGPWEFSWTWFVGSSLALWWYASGLVATPPVDRPARWRSVLYFAGVLVIYAVLQSRFEYLAQHMFFINRIQALVLHDVGPILIALSWPWAILVRGMPRLARYVLQFLGASALMRVLRQPAIATVLFVAIVALWLIPTLHFRAMVDPKLYLVMNSTMVVDGLLFWFLVLDRRPKPPAPLSHGVRVLMLMGVLLPQTVIGAVIALSPRDLYPFYDWCGRIYPTIGALQDQQLGGLIIWIPSFMMTAMALVFALNALLQTSSNANRESTSCT